MKDKITSIDSKSTSKAVTKKSTMTAKSGERLQVRLSAATNSLLRTAIAANRGISASFITEMAVREWLTRNPLRLQMTPNEVQVTANEVKNTQITVTTEKEVTANEVEWTQDAAYNRIKNYPKNNKGEIAWDSLIHMASNEFEREILLKDKEYEEEYII